MGAGNIKSALTAPHLLGLGTGTVGRTVTLQVNDQLGRQSVGWCLDG